MTDLVWTAKHPRPFGSHPTPDVVTVKNSVREVGGTGGRRTQQHRLEQGASRGCHGGEENTMPAARICCVSLKLNCGTHIPPALTSTRAKHEDERRSCAAHSGGRSARARVFRRTGSAARLGVEGQQCAGLNCGWSGQEREER